MNPNDFIRPNSFIKGKKYYWIKDHNSKQDIVKVKFVSYDNCSATIKIKIGYKRSQSVQRRDIYIRISE